MNLQDNTISNILAAATQRLRLAGCDTPKLDAELLMAHTLGQTRAWLYTHPQGTLTPSQYQKFFNLLARRERREPVAYLTGRKAFFGLEFWVTPHVLIPRPETELLVETAIQLTAAATALTLVDVGTGSGCIAIALAKNIAAVNVLAIDVSAQALQVAQKNAADHQVTPKITFLQGNLLQPLTVPVDLIVSNPPYVTPAELENVAPEVGQYEPQLALNGGANGLQIIEKLLSQARTRLKPKGSLLVEIGATQGNSVRRLAQQYFPQATVCIKKDLAGLDRLLAVEHVNR